MPSTQELLQAITGMQQNAQAALPVIPNNGNPRGANNMPASDVPSQSLPQVPGADKYPWLAPSDNMQLIRDMLNRPIAQANTGIVPPAGNTYGSTQGNPYEQPRPMAPPMAQPLQPSAQPVIPTSLNPRQQMRAEGDWANIHKLGQRQGIANPEYGQELMSQVPTIPLRGQGF